MAIAAHSYGDAHAVYDRHDFIAEKRAGLEKWDRPRPQADHRQTHRGRNRHVAAGVAVMATRKKKPRHTISENSVTALLMRAAEQSSEGPYPLLCRQWLASSDRFDDPAGRDLAQKIIEAYAAEHPLPRPGAEDVAATVDWKNILRGLSLVPEHDRSLESARLKLLAQARAEVAEEVGKSPEAVKLLHTRVKRRPPS